MVSEDFSATVMVGIDGTVLSEADKARLHLPAVGAVCLFARNYESITQLTRLVADIRAVAPRPLLVAVDQEGGRVQRFGPPDFELIAPASELGKMFASEPEAALAAALARGEQIAASLAGADIDLSFVPLLDLDHGRSQVIGHRSFSGSPQAVAALGMAMCAGLASVGMGAVGKHFPGHGWAADDTHAGAAVDERSLAQIEAADILPFASLIERKLLAAVMLAHVIYPQVENCPATYSQVWIKDVLRGKLGFAGPVLTDDLVMDAAACGDLEVAQRVGRAAAAGCDLFLVCGGEPVLADAQIARLPAGNPNSLPWRALARRSQA